MMERFEEIFEEYLVEVERDWYEVFDSEEFEVVESRIAAEFGAEALESEEFTAWTSEMGWDL